MGIVGIGIQTDVSFLLSGRNGSICSDAKIAHIVKVSRFGEPRHAGQIEGRHRSGIKERGEIGDQVVLRGVGVSSTQPREGRAAPVGRLQS